MQPPSVRGDDVRWTIFLVAPVLVSQRTVYHRRFGYEGVASERGVEQTRHCYVPMAVGQREAPTAAQALALQVSSARPCDDPKGCCLRGRDYSGNLYHVRPA